MAVDRTIAERLYCGLAPLAFACVRVAARIGGVDRQALRQRTGHLAEVDAPCLWLHGASAGEMAAAANLVALLRAHGHRFAAAYTATNEAGLALVGGRLRDGDVACLAPWDVSRWVGRALDRWRPLALLLIETELWPALVLAAAERGVPVLAASARVYPRDVPRYRLARPLVAPMLARLSAVLAQTESERRRFIDIGAPPSRCRVTGNLKHLAAPTAADGRALRRAVGLDASERVVVFGSLHADEVPFAADAIDRLGENAPRIIVAPRQPAALRALADEAVRRRWLCTTRGAARGRWRVLLLDTMGELRAAYAGAAVAAVGGSFGRHGGHDLIEAVRAGAPVLFGPHTRHVEAEAGALCVATPEARVRTPEGLAARVAAWLADEPRRRAAWARQSAALPDPGAIADGYRAALAEWMDGCRPSAMTKAACS